MNKIKRLASLFAALLMLSSAACAEEASLTTGLMTDQPYCPMVVQMDNEPGARPQCGIASADVIYETEVYDGGYTRYTCVFNDTIPERVEAVRSARLMHLDIYQDWGGAFVNYGFQNAEGSDAASYAQEVVTTLYNGITGLSAFYRDNSRKAPNNVVCRLRELYDQTESPEARSPLCFSDTPTLQGEAVTAFSVPYSESRGYYPSYEWDAEAGVYLRSYNGKAHLDGTTGEQVSCANVIVQYVDYSWYAGDGNRPIVEMTGTNRCDYFIGGMHFTGYWTRERVSDNTTYYDDAGNVVQLARGKTCIQLLRDTKSVEIQQQGE